MEKALNKNAPPYRGRLAPSPTGRLHRGHANTFSIAAERARIHNGTLVLRNENLDPDRSKPEHLEGIINDLTALGISWQEGPFHQSERLPLYHRAWEYLKKNNFIYPCLRSRKDIASAILAPHNEDEACEPIFLKEWRPHRNAHEDYSTPEGANWRFRVPDNEKITFYDNNLGTQSFIAGQNFGDFIIWRRDNIPAYELAVVVDDHEMNITEVVRGEDLLMSTARQILLYRALGWETPQFYHCPLILDDKGQRLSKRKGDTLLQPITS
ncbi:MAG: tRNA glutamyl-Q synthetase [Verrucomicrobia bacterium CG_4_10_14_3_um_filter_43_23]|nr:MAG: hypothetical protein AUJ82_04330 [Verrucomicrobia bacterium CG1_02_43_26]PIP59074.1 MAG: tRNA glutamyl-Q synthetase [Verrucomicrobia bacterium CG22_combo_CG10-13_8_21_14_all_43_17]PIX59171.1 MAG: tRNA glutamyl-Q synthetase [Verrucomicrobia bacterium CG_4_10_14_3_um_filter_43_23]PIY61304.1 MAG: tRNA glutamyl-Q synthetase [Verrucomicrobia bacterium CG_4_10_14_0_8_um_filter_43_34]PJA44086.1 MAG: tRNA glutamyl-Q synthetase [Verrucomicrobia bacterium CG_4_9_14_3_um_filter_43_20]